MAVVTRLVAVGTGVFISVRVVKAEDVAAPHLPPLAAHRDARAAPPAPLGWRADAEVALEPLGARKARTG